MSNSKHTPPPPPPPPSLLSLPEEIVLSCVARVPRIYQLNLSWVSKTLNSLVRSLPELKGLPSVVPHKNSLYVCFQQDDNSSLPWFTLNATSTTEYSLVPNPTPFPSHPKYGSLTVAVGSKIFFIGGSIEPSTDLWILDTRSGTVTQAPSMSLPRVKYNAAVGVIDGKIYVIGGVPLFHEEIEVELFDLKSKTWELAGLENVRKASRCSASVEGKVYMVERDEIRVYNPRECEGERMFHMVTKRLSKGGRKYKLDDRLDCVCVVEDILFAFFDWNGIMWFDTNLNVWRRLVGLVGNWKKRWLNLSVEAMAEHDGKLVVLYMYDTVENDLTISKVVRCDLVSLHRAGDRICGTTDWLGFVGTVLCTFCFLHFLAVSN